MPASFEEFDDLAWDHGNALFLEWKKRLTLRQTYYDVAKKVEEHANSGRATKIDPPQKGAFNVYYRVHFSHGPKALIRFPIPAYFQYREEKLMGEVAVMRYVADKTSVPVPLVLYHGSAEESPGGLGPFVIMEWVENEGDLADVLNTPGLAYSDPPVLNPQIDPEILDEVYSQLADILLQLYACDLEAIGSLDFLDGDVTRDPVVCRRPLSLNLSQLVNFARVPDFELPSRSQTYKSSSEYYRVLADMHLRQLSFQRNQAISSADDCRRKYVARQLFRYAASRNRLADPRFDRGPFKLWCDDLRPANILVGRNNSIAAVIDWEFAYAAPAEFAFSPPWWLLLKAPDDWEAGLDDWVDKYEPRFRHFLSVLERRERELIEQGRMDTPHRLSGCMRESWESGHFWVAYAAQRSWAFDAIYWKFLDERLFGKNESGDLRERLKLLPAEQVHAMEEFVERKLREKNERTLVDWHAEPDARARASVPAAILDR
ncbi:hypothetical protein VTK73DRAFT_6348 [Phialemonium thermophilum]|uniref:Aminoglycoside phosphotransferase domain-containing protein n=1 Tax=Phialemonium thermophilum TaxID=223376 RepID=A0ABR3WJW7_9PEZI